MWNPETWTAEAWTQFLQEHWYIIVAALVIILLVVKLVKTVLKWLLVAVIVVGVVFYSGYSLDDLTTAASQASAVAKDEVIKAIAGEADKAQYETNEDGSYTIKTPSLELSGFPNSDEVKVKLGGVPLGTWKLDGEVRDFVNEARAAARQ